VRSTVIFVANAIKKPFKVRSTVTFATNVAVLRTSKRIFYRVCYKDCGATHLEKEMGNGQRLKLAASYSPVICLFEKQGLNCGAFG
jgi:hypothetical protein